MSRLILGVTGSVAAIKTPALVDALRGAGHVVGVVATEPALYFFDPAEVDPSSASARLVDRTLFRDNDEWPGARYQREDEVLHIQFRNWADLLILAPLDANTLCKIAVGISDNFL